MHNSVVRCVTIFEASGDPTRQDVIELISPTNPARLLAEGWVAHPDGDIPLFTPPGGEHFFTLVEPGVRRASGVFMQRYLSVDELCEELIEDELAILAQWLQHIINEAGDADSLLVRWAGDLRWHVVAWLDLRHWQADWTASRDGASASTR